MLVPEDKPAPIWTAEQYRQYRQQLAQAEEMHHPSTLTSMNNLAYVLSGQGKVRAGGRDALTSTRAEGDGAG
jgi:hypothetical protein